LLLCHGTVCVVGKMRDLILQLSKSSIYSTKPVVTADTLHKTQNVGPVAFHEAQFNFRTHNNHI
ncbi:hypothetical protein ABS828_26625, partial [Klebsiella pneumoniae]